LVNLLKNTKGIKYIIARGDTPTNFDYQCPLLSLPLVFKTELFTIPPPQAISTHKEKITEWQAKLGEKTKPRIGIVWSGNTEHKNDHNRSLTLSKLLRYLPANVEYICLQKELRATDKELLSEHSQIKYFGDNLEDFTDTSALCELMDVVISVDTSVAHLAGTLGKPTWVLLPYSPDWRWLLDRVDSPWYPSVKLYRQEKIYDWDGVLEKVRFDLEELVT
jgi:ADP-heptose:LPS heptosyltransferase